MTTKRIQSDEEIRVIRAQLVSRHSDVGPGYTGMIIERLCDTVDELRRLLAGRSA